MITHESSLKDFTSQIQYVLDHFSAHEIKIEDYNNILLGGLGGSGIAASIVKDYFADKCPVPIECVKDYYLPKYVNEKTLVILNSYSGNTEETLAMYAIAKERGAKVIVLSSGGELEKQATENGEKFYRIPTGFQPRMTIGFGLSYLLLILGELNGIDHRSDLEEVIKSFAENHEKQLNTATKISEFFLNTPGHKFVIVCDQQMYGPAVRFTQQLNENTKLEGFVNVLPESNHNVIEGYTDKMSTNFVLLYTTVNDRVGARFDFLLGHLEMDNNRVVPVVIPEYTIYSIFDVIYRLDWVSVMMANELDANLMEVPIITELKGYLSNIEFVEEEDADETDDPAAGLNNPHPGI